MGRTTEEQLDRYELYARVGGFSRAQVDQTRSCIGLLEHFLHRIEDIKEITAADRELCFNICLLLSARSR